MADPISSAISFLITVGTAVKEIVDGNVELDEKTQEFVQVLQELTDVIQEYSERTEGALVSKSIVTALSNLQNCVQSAQMTFDAESKRIAEKKKTRSFIKKMLKLKFDPKGELKKLQEATDKVKSSRERLMQAIQFDKSMFVPSSRIPGEESRKFWRDQFGAECDSKESGIVLEALLYHLRDIPLDEDIHNAFNQNRVFVERKIRSSSEGTSTSVYAFGYIFGNADTKRQLHDKFQALVRKVAEEQLQAAQEAKQQALEEENIRNDTFSNASSSDSNDSNSERSQLIKQLGVLDQKSSFSELNQLNETLILCQPNGPLKNDSRVKLAVLMAFRSSGFVDSQILTDPVIKSRFIEMIKALGSNTDEALQKSIDETVSILGTNSNRWTEYAGKLSSDTLRLIQIVVYGQILQTVLDSSSNNDSIREASVLEFVSALGSVLSKVKEGCYETLLPISYWEQILVFIVPLLEKSKSRERELLDILTASHSVLNLSKSKSFQVDQTLRSEPVLHFVQQRLGNEELRASAVHYIHLSVFDAPSNPLTLNPSIFGWLNLNIPSILIGRLTLAVLRDPFPTEIAEEMCSVLRYMLIDISHAQVYNYLFKGFFVSVSDRRLEPFVIFTKLFVKGSARIRRLAVTCMTYLLDGTTQLENAQDFDDIIISSTVRSICGAPFEMKDVTLAKFFDRLVQKEHPAFDSTYLAERGATPYLSQSSVAAIASVGSPTNTRVQSVNPTPEVQSGPYKPQDLWIKILDDKIVNGQRVFGLRSIASHMGLKSGGRKQELIDRIIQAQKSQ